jgi:hypothetical protein
MPRANPTIVSYITGVVKTHNARVTLCVLKTKIMSSTLKNGLANNNAVVVPM